jgi:hypothetical protein
VILGRSAQLAEPLPARVAMPRTGVGRCRAPCPQCRVAARAWANYSGTERAALEAVGRVVGHRDRLPIITFAAMPRLDFRAGEDFEGLVAPYWQSCAARPSLLSLGWPESRRPAGSPLDSTATEPMHRVSHCGLPDINRVDYLALPVLFPNLPRRAA